MIAKLITYGKDRAEAIARLEDALDHYEVRGIQSNRQFLSSVLENEDYRKGDITTGFIASHYEDGFTARPASGDDKTKMIALAAGAIYAKMAYLAFGAPPTSFIVTSQNDEDAYHSVEVALSGSDVIIHRGNSAHILSDMPSAGLYLGQIDGGDFPAQMVIDNHHVTITKGAMRERLQILPSHIGDYIAHMPQRDEGAGADEVLAPMPGLLTRLLVAEGDAVKKGQNVAVIEAMKMENMLVAEANGTVKSVIAKLGSNLNVEDLILTLALDDEG